jgi:dGTP triphosphohydrolase
MHHNNSKFACVEHELASFAMRSESSRGRKYAEAEHPYRSVFQRDRDRIIHKLYRHFKVVRMTSKAQRFLKELFAIYLENPEQLPPGTANKSSQEMLDQSICDYLAGMTDRYALDEYKKLFHPWEKV